MEILKFQYIIYGFEALLKIWWMEMVKAEFNISFDLSFPLEVWKESLSLILLLRRLRLKADGKNH